MIKSEIFSTAHVMTTCGDGLTAEYLEFGFRSVGIRIHNSCGPRVFYNLLSCVATSKDDFIACAAAATFQDIGSVGLALLTTSTSTVGGAIARPLIGINAWASA